jgi:hypothetical protein
LRTKRGTTANGGERGGKPLSRGHIYRLLANPIYTGSDGFVKSYMDQKDRRKLIARIPN